MIITDENRERWIKKVSLEPSLIESVRNCDVLLLPTDFKDITNGFYSTSSDFLQYIQKKENITTDICINDDDYKLISLNSREFRLGDFILKGMVLPIFIGVVIEYISDYLKASPKEDKVSISIIIEKDDGNYKLEYNGNIENFLKLEGKLNEKTKNEENNRSSTKFQNKEI
ncbi:hypothetical protein [Bibersteinia trehalosi]|uniref:hypothetical protein n=1 Tax=Bibersteinia trehalosi TaxID=47735 RepID=UPI002D765A6B|nr:hypothetical protein [Bibersteinia trehalosi]